jgi:NADPH-dependent ferric siderophore reductase
MLRVRLGGPGLAGFPAGAEGGYVKLMLPSPQAGARPVVRTYTVRHQTADSIDVDFALHQDGAGGHGPATAWALATRPGEIIEVGGPGPAKALPGGHGFYLVAGDMTALPAIAVNLAALPADTRGAVVIELSSADDRQDLARPAGVALTYLVNHAPGTDPQALAQALAAQDPGGDEVYAWVACEFSAMRALREYLRGQRGLGPDRLYISSYWKQGATEEAHKVVKREDAELAG